jgi:cytochrome c-type biogenesis protein CcmE
MKNGSFRYVAGITVILIAFGLLVMGSMRSNTLRAMPVDQLVDTHSMVGQRLRIAGFVGSAPVTKTSIQTSQGTLQIKHFNVVYHGKTVAVSFQDALPDMFKAGLPVQVEGVYTAPGELKADQVLTKCPSKYQAEEAQNALKQERTSKSKQQQSSSSTKY